jgi:hypothetical protein
MNKNRVSRTLAQGVGIAPLITLLFSVFFLDGPALVLLVKLSGLAMAASLVLGHAFRPRSRANVEASGTPQGRMRSTPLIEFIGVVNIVMLCILFYMIFMRASYIPQNRFTILVLSGVCAAGILVANFISYRISRVRVELIEVRRQPIICRPQKAQRGLVPSRRSTRDRLRRISRIHSEALRMRAVC